jgi:hypothetical protein
VRNYFLVALALLCTALGQETPDQKLGAFYLKGVLYEAVSSPKFTVVSSADNFGRYLRIRVYVKNESENPVTIHPEQMTVWDRVTNTFLAQTPQLEVAKKARPGAWARGLRGFGQGMQEAAQENTQTVHSDTSGDVRVRDFEGNTYTGTYDGQVTSTFNSCDSLCQKRKQAIAERYARLEQKENDQAALIRNTALLTETVFSGKELDGFVYYEIPKNSKKRYAVLVTVPLGQEQFRFVFPLK